MPLPSADLFPPAVCRVCVHLLRFLAHTRDVRPLPCVSPSHDRGARRVYVSSLDCIPLRLAEQKSTDGDRSQPTNREAVSLTMVCVVHVAPVGVHLTFPRTHETFARTPPRTPSAPPHNARIPSSCRRPFLVLHLTLRQQNACRQQCDVPGYRVKLMLWWITWRARHCCGLGGRPTRRYFVHFSLLDNPLVQVSFERSYARGSRRRAWAARAACGVLQCVVSVGSPSYHVWVANCGIA